MCVQRLSDEQCNECIESRRQNAASNHVASMLLENVLTAMCPLAWENRNGDCRPACAPTPQSRSNLGVSIALGSALRSRRHGTSPQNRRCHGRFRAFWYLSTCVTAAAPRRCRRPPLCRLAAPSAGLNPAVPPRLPAGGWHGSAASGSTAACESAPVQQTSGSSPGLF